MTSKVVNMAPCSNRKEGKKEGRKMEGRDRNSRLDKLAGKKEEHSQRAAKGLEEQVIVPILPRKTLSIDRNLNWSR